MKKILLGLLMLVFTASLARAQGTATQQQLDELRGHYQDAQEALRLQDQRIAALEKEIGELREKVNAPVVHEDYANREDLKRLAEQVQEIDRKRAEDRELILNQIDKIGKATAAANITPLPPPRHSTPKPPADDAGTSATPQVGHEYEVKPGDTLGLIVKAYRDAGVKVTKSQIIKANPKMNPDVLIPGKKIFIPDPAAK